MYWTSVLPIVLAIALATVYLWQIHRKVRDEWWSATHTMVSILFSVLISLGIGYYVFHWESDAQRKAERMDLELLVSNELGVVEMDLAIGGRDTIKLKDTSVVVNLTVLPTLALQSAGTSGVFESVESWRMLSLVSQIDKHNLYIEHMLRLLSISEYSATGQRKVLHTYDRISKKQENIADNCGRLRQELSIDENKYAQNMITKNR